MASLDNAKGLVHKLFEFRENFISENGTKNIHKKQQAVGQMLEEVLKDLDKMQLTIDNKALFFYLRGRALNVQQQFDPRAIECLSKAIKLDPTFTEAWNELGECYWKEKKVEEAYNCFNAANKKMKNKISLRNLSMVQRQLYSDFQSRVENIKQSVITAKSAVAMDVTDGKSWFVLGNAYLSLFFFAGQSPTALKQCMVAYSKSLEDKHALNNADLYYNQAVAYKYQERYQQALESYRMAGLLDPGWNDPKENAESLCNRLKLTMSLIEKKGNHKQKKLRNMIGQLKDSDYGVYSSGVYTSPSGQTVVVEKKQLSEMRLERNTRTVVCGKVISVVPVRDGVPFCFVLMDASLDCIAVSVFNMAVDKGVIVGDSVAIPEPYVEHHEIKDNDSVYFFRNIRVDFPAVLVVNKRKVGSERLAFSVLTVTNESE